VKPIWYENKYIQQKTKDLILVLPGSPEMEMEVYMIFGVPLVLSPQPEGGFTVTSLLLPELVTEGDTIEEAMDNVRDALEATVEMYQDLGRPLPKNVQILDTRSPVWIEALVATS
jgi:antitoxin HicB